MNTFGSIFILVAYFEISPQFFFQWKFTPISSHAYLHGSQGCKNLNSEEFNLMSRYMISYNDIYFQFTKQLEGGKDDKSGGFSISKKKHSDEIIQKAEESEKNYKNVVDDANFQQKKLESTKRDVSVELRQLIYQCDLPMKSVTVAYFHMMNNVFSPLPIQYRALFGSSYLYEEGQQFADFVKLQQSTCNQAMCPTYYFEAYRTENERYQGFYGHGLSTVFYAYQLVLCQ